MEVDNSNALNWASQMIEELMRPYLKTCLVLLRQRGNVSPPKGEAEGLLLGSAALLILFAGYEALANLLIIASYLSGRIEPCCVQNILRKGPPPGHLACSMGLEEKIKWLCENGCDWESVDSLRTFRNMLAHNFSANAGYKLKLEEDTLSVYASSVEFSYTGDPLFYYDEIHAMCDEIIARSRVYMESLRLPDALEEIERCVGLLPSPSQTKIMRVLELLDPSVNDPTADYRAVEPREASLFGWRSS
jgi:hypothetical protein